MTRKKAKKHKPAEAEVFLTPTREELMALNALGVANFIEALWGMVPSAALDHDIENALGMAIIHLKDLAAYLQRLSVTP